VGGACRGLREGEKRGEPGARRTGGETGRKKSLRTEGKGEKDTDWLYRQLVAGERDKKKQSQLRKKVSKKAKVRS